MVEPLLRDLALCIRRQAIARPWKIHGLARGEQMPPPSRPFRWFLFVRLAGHNFSVLP